jgi:hypothetical protein
MMNAKTKTKTKKTVPLFTVLTVHNQYIQIYRYDTVKYCIRLIIIIITLKNVSLINVALLLSQ